MHTHIHAPAALAVAVEVDVALVHVHRARHHVAVLKHRLLPELFSVQADGPRAIGTGRPATPQDGARGCLRARARAPIEVHDPEPIRVIDGLGHRHGEAVDAFLHDRLSERPTPRPRRLGARCRGGAVPGAVRGDVRLPVREGWVPRREVGRSGGSGGGSGKGGVEKAGREAGDGRGDGEVVERHLGEGAGVCVGV